MLASTVSLAAEYTPNRTRDFWVSFVISGYPVGAVLSGLVAAKVITQYGWPQMFQLAGIASLITIPLIFIFLSESIEFYLKKQPKMALEKANLLLSKMGFDRLESLPVLPHQKKGLPIRSILKDEYRIPTIQLWIALFLAFATLYFLTSWIPKLASNAGLSLALSIYAGTIFNFGAFFGIITQGYFSSRYGLKKTIGIFFIFTAILMAIFGVFLGSDILLVIFGLLGFGIQGGFVGLYAVSTRMYPTEFRTTGVGWSIGMGRLGGIIGPAAGGILIGMGLTMVQNFLIYAIPTLLAGIMTMYISSKEIR
jgi:MFS family permease